MESNPIKTGLSVIGLILAGMTGMAAYGIDQELQRNNQVRIERCTAAETNLGLVEQALAQEGLTTDHRIDFNNSRAELRIKLQNNRCPGFEAQ